MKRLSHPIAGADASAISGQIQPHRKCQDAKILMCQASAPSRAKINKLELKLGLEMLSEELKRPRCQNAREVFNSYYFLRSSSGQTYLIWSNPSHAFLSAEARLQKSP